MRFSTLLLAVTCLALAFSATAFATPAFEWQTEPILGTDVTYTGDVVVNTGPIPITIPHYSISGDPLYGVGSPSMTLFSVGQSVATGSGMWITPDDLYTITGVFQQISGGSRTTTYQDLYTGSPDGFVMEAFTSVGNLAEAPQSGSPLVNLSSSDVGNWTYTETWFDQTTNTTLTATNEFSVVVPEPGALLLLGSALLGLAAYRKLLT